MNRKKTSIKVEEELWRTFGAQLTMEGLDYSEAIEAMIRERLGKKAPIVPISGSMSVDQEVMEGLRRLLRAEKTALLTFPQLLGVSRETLAAFMAKKNNKLICAS